MIDQLMTDKEVELLLQVLTAEHNRILPEIHHTDSRMMRRDLVERARILERLIERFRQAEASAHTPPATT
jgi:hypothetical protein